MIIIFTHIKFSRIYSPTRNARKFIIYSNYFFLIKTWGLPLFEPHGFTPGSSPRSTNGTLFFSCCLHPSPPHHSSTRKMRLESGESGECGRKWNQCRICPLHNKLTSQGAGTSLQCRDTSVRKEPAIRSHCLSRLISVR